MFAERDGSFAGAVKVFTFRDGQTKLTFPRPGFISMRNASHPLPPRPHILLVDDNPDELRLLVEMLGTERYRISIAFDGSQGYRRAVTSSPDLILMDVRMHGLDGFAACRLLKTDPATAAIPVIFLSASNDVSERLRGLREGAVDYVAKPFSAEEVIARIQIHLTLAAGVAMQDALPPSPAQVSDSHAILQAAQHYLLRNLMHTPTLQEVARQAGTHEKRLSLVFRELLGQSVFGYLREQRLALAKRLLGGSSLSILEIADEVGFAKPTNFATAFREHAGMTPTQYRRRAQALAGAAPALATGEP